MRERKIYIFLFFLPFILISLFFIFLPLSSIIINSFKSDIDGSYGLKNYISLFSNDYYIVGIINSIKISFISALVGIFIDFLGAYIIYNNNGTLKKSFLNILNMTSNFQGIQLAFGFMILLGNAGVITLIGQKLGIEFLANYDLYSAKGLLIAYIHFQIPLGTILLYPSFNSIRKEYKEAASLFGTTTFEFWRYIGVPIILPSILGTFSILFANALAAYATPYALLGNNYPLIPIQISSMFTGDLVQQPGLGSALSVIMILFMLGLNMINVGFLKLQTRRIVNEKQK